MNHFETFLARAQANGLSTSEALTHPGAQAAARLDDEAAREAHRHGTKNEFLAAFASARKMSGGPAGFIDQEEMQAAMADPAYDTNPEYRAAVAAIVARTSEKAIGLSIDAKFSDGYKVSTGTYAPEGKATVATMLDHARREALREHVNGIDQSTAKGRYELMRFIANNPDAANAVYEDITPSSQVTHDRMTSDKLDGNPDSIVLYSDAEGDK